MIASRDDMSAQIEEIFRNRWRNAEAAGGVFAVDHKQINRIGFKHMGEVFADDVAAGGAKYIADKKNIHQLSLHAWVVVFTGCAR